jgi:hypothetical protein
MSRFSENFQVINVIKPADNEAGATGDSINMGLLHRVTYILTCGALTGDAVLTIKSGASAGTETTSETFRYRLADADQASANADLYAAWTEASTLTLTAATYDNKILICEIDSAKLTQGQPWLTFSLSNAASAHTSACIAIGEQRYSGHDGITVI